MKLIITLTQRGRKRPFKMEAELSEPLTLTHLRRIFEAEQTLNNLPANMRIHIYVKES